LQGSQLTVCVREAWQVCFDRLNNQVGVDSAWEQKKLEARKMLKNGDESHLRSPSLSKCPVHALLGMALENAFALIFSA